MNIIINESEAGQRLDRFLRKYCRPYPEIKLNDIYTRIRTGQCRINGKKSQEQYRLVSGDIISWKANTTGTTHTSLPEATKTKKQKITNASIYQLRNHILFEDAHRIVRNKPADLVTHPWKDHSTDLSLHDMMQSYLQQTNQKKLSPTFNPSFCFRLDKDTSGVIISAKTYDALQRLNQQIRERKVKKHYIAIVSGAINRSLRMVWNLKRDYDNQFGKAKMIVDSDEGKESLTIATPMRTIHHHLLWPISMVEVELHTGRMHQIRAHLQHAWFPIIGDLMYGNPAINRLAKKLGITRQLLHSHTYSFFDKWTKSNLTVSAPLPELFTKLFA